MAAENPVERLQKEATCSICLEYFREPVTLECGHSFCQACISHVWEELDTSVSCPQCKQAVQQRNFRPNRQLANVIEIVKKLCLQAEKGGGERVCGEHQEALELFCETDQTLICVVCDRSRAHRTHNVVTIEEAAQEYKEKIEAYLKAPREERETLLAFKMSREKRLQECLEKTQMERIKIVSEFQQLRQFLEKKEQLLLARLEKLDKRIMTLENDNVTKLSQEISCLSNQITEIEGKCQKPASEFLQDVKLTLRSYEKRNFLQPAGISPELEIRRCDFSQKMIDLTETLGKIKDTLTSQLQTRGEYLRSFTQVNVTLDPDTAHPELILSKDRKSVTWECKQWDLPDNPKRFNTERCVLGCEGFTSGRHCWEVEVRDGKFWAVGVARESVRRKGKITFNPEQGIWAVWQCGNQFQAATSLATPLTLNGMSNRIQVCLDCEWRQVTFFDVVNDIPIFVFPLASVPGERIHPWLRVWDVETRLRLT